MNNDIIFCIFEYLNLVDLINCALTNKQFNITSKNETLWHNLFLNKYGSEVRGSYANYRDYHIVDEFLLLNNTSLSCTYIRDILCLSPVKSVYIPKEVIILSNLQKLTLQCGPLKSLP